MPTSSPNLGLQYPLGTENVSVGPADFSQIVNLLDGTGGTVTRIVTGTLATFNASYSSTPGSYVLGTLYVATDTGSIYIRDSVPSWKQITAGATGGGGGSSGTVTSTPIASTTQYAGTSDPIDSDSVVRWLICDGRAISRTTYASLFTAISTTYGTGNGTTTFNIPDLRGRTAIGAGTGSGLTTRALAGTGGEENHIITTTEMPVHTHTASPHSHTDSGHSHTDAGHGHTASSDTQFPFGGWVVAGSTQGMVWTFVGSGSSIGVRNGGATDWQGLTGAHAHNISVATGHASISTGNASISNTTVSNANTGSGSSHNNMQPYLVMNYIIKVQ